LSERDGYGHFELIPTRWLDNDLYGHVNNAVYYALFDTIINRWLIDQGGLDIQAGGVIGVCAESHCRYREALSYPETVEAGLRVGHLGNRSVRYEIGLFKEGSDNPAAEGWFVHVFVDRESRQPAPIPPPIREALERLAAAEAA
jgi:acyl-CoA thioester hydrolase